MQLWKTQHWTFSSEYLLYSGDLRGFLVVVLNTGVEGPSPALFRALTEMRYAVLPFRPESSAAVSLTLTLSASLSRVPSSHQRTWPQTNKQENSASDISRQLKDALP